MAKTKASQKKKTKRVKDDDVRKVDAEIVDHEPASDEQNADDGYESEDIHEITGAIDDQAVVPSTAERGLTTGHDALALYLTLFTRVVENARHFRVELLKVIFTL